MKKSIATAVFALLFIHLSTASVLGTAAAAETFKRQAPSKSAVTDDELGVMDELPTPGKPQRKGPALKKEDVPPLKMVKIKGGCYKMGDSTGTGDEDERPVHDVCVSDFYLSETEVTQAFYDAVVGENISRVRGDDMPVTNITWLAARAFVKRLNELTKSFYRLPTEAEWEYAAREGGKDIRWAGTNNEGEIGDYAWYSDNTDEKPHAVKTRKPNALGLYDMSGNVWEWVDDNFDFDYYQHSPLNDPFGPDQSAWRVIRGGSFLETPASLRATYRYAVEPDKHMATVGFRIAQ